MQKEIGDKRSKRERQSLIDHGSQCDCRETSNSSETSHVDVGRRRQQFGADTAEASKEGSVSGLDESTSAARLRRSSRLPRPTSSASNGHVEVRREEDMARVRRSRRLPTLQGVVISGPTYTAKPPTGRQLVANIVSKCHIPAPVTTRRISSWTGGSPSQKSASRPRVKIKVTRTHHQSQSNPPAERSLVNFGCQSTTGTEAFPCSDRSIALPSTTRLELKCGVRFSSDAMSVRREHVCCGCAGIGMVVSHLSCIRCSKEWGTESERKSARRASGRAARVRRFYASTGHRVAVAQEAVECGLEILPSELHRSDMARDIEVSKTTSGAHKHNNTDQVGHVTNERKFGAMENPVTVDVMDQRVPEEVNLVNESDETGSRRPSSKRDNKKLKSAAMLASSTVSGSSLLSRSKQGTCSLREEGVLSGTFSDDYDARLETMRAEAAQLDSPSYSERRRAEDAKKLEKIAKNQSVRSLSSEVRMTTSTTQKPTGLGPAAKRPTVSHVGEELKRKRLKDSCQDDGKRKRCTRPPEEQQITSVTPRFVTLSGRDVPVSFVFPARGEIGRHSQPSVASVNKDVRSQIQRSARGEATPPAPRQESHVVAEATADSVERSNQIQRPAGDESDEAALPRARQQCHNVTEATADLTESSPEQVKCLLASEYQLTDTGRDGAVEDVSTANVASVHVIEFSDDLYTSDNLDIREQIECKTCDSTTVSSVQQCQSAATPSFFIGIAPPSPSPTEYCRKRPVTWAGDTHSVQEPTPSFILSSASEKNFSRTTTRKKNATEKASASVRRKMSPTKDTGSITRSTRNENRLSSASSRRGKNRQSPAASVDVENRRSTASHQNKTSSQLRTAVSTCQRQLASSQAPVCTTSKTSDTPTRRGSAKRLPVTLCTTEATRVKDTKTRREDVKSNNRTGNAVSTNASSQKRPIDLCFTSKCGQSPCTNRQMNRSEFYRDSTTMFVFDSAQATRDGNVPSVRSQRLSDDISTPRPDELPTGRVRDPASFFISCPWTGVTRGGPRTASKTSRIPRRQISTPNLLVKSHSYVVGTAGTATKPRSGITGSVSAECHLSTGTDVGLCLPVNQDPASDDGMSAPSLQTPTSDVNPSKVVVASDSIATADYTVCQRNPPDVDDGKTQEESVFETSFTVDSVDPTPGDVTAPNHHAELHHCRRDDHESKEVDRATDHQLLGDAPLRALSTVAATDLSAPVHADVIINNEQCCHSQLISECAVSADDPVFPEPSEEQFQRAYYFSPLFGESDPDELAKESCNIQLQHSSIGSVEYVNAVETREERMFLEEDDPECPITVEVTRIEDDALELSTTLPTQRTEASETPSSRRCAKSNSEMNLSIGLEVGQQLRNFDEVGIELPDVVWSRLQSEEIRHPEEVSLCPSVFEAVVLRSAVRPPLSPQGRQSVSDITPVERAAAVPCRLLAKAQRRRHFVESPEELSINVVNSRVDQAVQSVNDTTPRLNLSNVLTWITGMDTPTGGTADYIAARRYLEQQMATQRTSTNKWKRNEPEPFVLPPNSNTRTNVIDELTWNIDETGAIQRELEERHRAQTKAGANRLSLISTSSSCTLIPEVRPMNHQIVEVINGQPRLRLPHPDVDSRVDLDLEDHTLIDHGELTSLDVVSRNNEDDVGAAVPVSEASCKADDGQPCWQTSYDNVDQPSRMTSGQ